MKHPYTCLLPLLVAVAACKSTETDSTTTLAPVEAASPAGPVEPDPELRTELLAMLAEDQAIREQGHQVLIVGGDEGHGGHGDGHADHDHAEGEHDHASGSVHGDEMHRVDAANTARLKEIVAERGWPGKSLVGREGALAAFLIAQHADADPAFQERCLELMRAMPPGEVSPGDIAYLTDRVRVNTGRKQLYGTQFWFEGGVFAPRPIEDPDGLAERRAEAGLIPMEQYLEHMRGHGDGTHEH
jgi:hypothetical protein